MGALIRTTRMFIHECHRGLVVGMSSCTARRSLPMRLAPERTGNLPQPERLPG
jgi:hypothetical protein